jgi:hypothetical protein
VRTWESRLRESGGLGKVRSPKGGGIPYISRSRFVTRSISPLLESAPCCGSFSPCRPCWPPLLLSRRTLKLVTAAVSGGRAAIIGSAATTLLRATPATRRLLRPLKLLRLLKLRPLRLRSNPTENSGHSTKPCRDCGGVLLLVGGLHVAGGRGSLPYGGAAADVGM